MNLASVWKVPVLFVCENNLYGEYSPLRSTTPVEDLAIRATSYDMRAQIGQMMTAQLQSTNVPENMRDKLAHFQKQLMDTIFEELAFAKMKPVYVDIYSSTFTAEELSGLVSFYKSPVGRAYANKLPALMKRMMEVAQTKMQTLAPRLKKMNDDFIAELKKGPSPP